MRTSSETPVLLTVPCSVMASAPSSRGRPRNASSFRAGLLVLNMIHLVSESTSPRPARHGAGRGARRRGYNAVGARMSELVDRFRDYVQTLSEESGQPLQDISEKDLQMAMTVLLVQVLRADLQI